MDNKKSMKNIRLLQRNFEALFNYRMRRTHLENPPSFIWIEPTNHCNLECIMCPNGTTQMTAEKGYMDYEFYKKIIDEIKDHTSTIVLALGGESMIHPDFFKMIKYARNNKIKVMLNTNATLLNEKNAQLLLESGVSYISFAFDGFNKSMYEKARKGAKFEKTLNNILHFLRLRKKDGKNDPFTILSILMLELEECSDEEKQLFLDKFNGLIDDIRLREVSTWGSTFKGTDKFNYRNNDFFHGPCSRLWSSICIAWNGDVLPCIYNMNHEYVLGNLKESSLLEIWNNKKSVALRKSMINGTYLDVSPLCENCIILGTPHILGIPAGIRISLADAVVNFTGYRFEKMIINLINKLKNGKFSSRPIS